MVEVPLIDALDDRQPAAVVEDARELRDPRAHAVGGSFGHPEPDFGLALDRILPAIRLFEADTEDAADRLPPHHRAVFLRAPAVGPWRREAAPRLVVGELNGRQLARGLEVRRPIRNEARFRIDRTDGRVPLLPEIRQTRLPPLEELTPQRVARVRRAGKLGARGVLVVLHAVDAETVAALWRPPVGEDAVHLVHGDDLAVDAVHELEVVGSERAGHPEIGVGPVPQRSTGSRHGDPVRMRLPHIVAHGVRIGARDDAHVERAAAGDERAEGIRLTHPRAAMVERDRGRVVRDDAAGAERGGIGVEPPEVVEPELRVEPARVVLDQRELHPPHRAIEPAREGVDTWRDRLRGGGRARGQESGRSAQRGERSSTGNLKETAAGKRVRHAPDCIPAGLRRSAVGAQALGSQSSKCCSEVLTAPRARAPSADRRR